MKNSRADKVNDAIVGAVLSIFPWVFVVKEHPVIPVVMIIQMVMIFLYGLYKEFLDVEDFEEEEDV